MSAAVLLRCCCRCYYCCRRCCCRCARRAQVSACIVYPVWLTAMSAAVLLRCCCRCYYCCRRCCCRCAHHAQVGACIVNPDKRIVGIGYNGFPAGCSDERLPWARAAPNELDTKYPYVCHAEMNAILNKNAADVRGCTIYVALFPCADCAKLIIQSGIAHVVYVSDKYRDAPAFVASRRMLDLAGVRCRRHAPARRRVTIDFGAADAATAEEAGIDGTL
eukprot:TRINITY_DN1824_c3_g1_i4.p3 TRINITY_DN1824_c3_g1~~TRINITY_DN1824_c3_g1_i4.p3  ORF type:complete len:219 (+),score=83.00 TRINITY_DN1824_c3_g1_i4:35-691(+)